MQTLKILFSVFLLTIFISSCSSNNDNDNITKVKYQIIGIDNGIMEINYKDASGKTITITDINDFSNNGDSKIISVSNLPFDAKLVVTVNNETDSSKTYNLVIYVNNETKSNKSMNVPANSTLTNQTEFTVE